MAKVSFGKAQQELLATKFLDNLGSSPEFSDFEPSETFRALLSLAGILLEETAKNLEKSTASGTLASSFTVLDPRRVGNDVVLDIEALAYYQFINRGVKGTKKGSGEFAFKTPFPSKKMVESVRKWMKVSGISIRNVKKPISKLEVKRKSIAQLDGAYAIARSIKQKGIKKTGFFDKAFQTTDNIAGEKLGLALKLDIINALPDNLNDGN